MAVTQNNITSDALPCKDCGRDKHPSLFAKRYHRDYKYRKLNNPSYVPTVRNSSYKCRKCTGEQLHELKCGGQCGLWKSLDEFSKNQRTKGENWCKDCVSWKGSLEPGAIPQAAPNADFAADEDENVHGGGFNSYDIEDGQGYDEDDYQSALLQWRGVDSAFDALSIADSSGPPPRSDAASIASSIDYVPPHLRGQQSSTPTTPTIASTGDYIPPHLQGRQMSSNSSATTSAVAPTVSVNGYAPPHLRGHQGLTTAFATPAEAASTANRSTASIPGNVPMHLRGTPATASGPIRQSESSRRDDMTSTSSISNPYEDAETGTSSSIVGRPVQFNAWGPAGQQQVQYRYPSGNTSVTAPAPLSRPTASAQASAPVSCPSTVAPARNNSNWAQPIGTRSAAPVYTRPAAGPSAPPRRNRNGYDSDGSQDEM